MIRSSACARGVTLIRRARTAGLARSRLLHGVGGALLLACIACDDGAEPSKRAPAELNAATPTAKASRAPSETGRSEPHATETSSAHAACQEEILRLRSELESEREKRVKREHEWLAYTQGFQDLAQYAAVKVPNFPTETGAASPTVPDRTGLETDLLAVAAAVTGAPSAPPAAAAKHAEETRTRSKEIFIKLRALLTIEEVHGFDLLEIGSLDSDGFVGPVVVRVLDDRGRALGSLAADRLRLEGSRSARTVTLVLEHGHERRQGIVTAFDAPAANSAVAHASEREALSADGRGGVRRIVLAGIDPVRWMSALPELFRPADLEPLHDDGLYDLARLRTELNRLLREDATGSTFRIVELGGVRHEVLRDVQIDVLDREGRIEKKVFADKLTCVREERGVQVLLEDGTTLRGDKQTPFLDGRLRVFLPRAEAEAWLRAGVPFAAPVPMSSSPPPSGPETKVNATPPAEAPKKTSGGG